MAIIDPGLLTSSIPGSDPCGPDLDETGDGAYLNFFAFAPFQLPDAFFVEGKPFDPSAPKFREATAQIPVMLAALMKRSSDLRLLVFLARFVAIKRSLADFVDVVSAIATLLTDRWDGVHPRPSEGSFKARVDVLEELNAPLVTFSLQFVTLLADRKHGAVAYRSKILAEQGKAADGSDAGDKPAGGRIAALPPEEIARIFAEAGEDALAPMSELFHRLATALVDIRARFVERTGGYEAPNLDKLQNVVDGVRELFAAAFPEPAGPDDDAAEDDAVAPPPSAIASPAQARRALEAARDYFCLHEPSSPALPLVAQALDLQGKTFVEVLEILAPGRHSSARYSIGAERFFKLAVAPLAPMIPTRPEYFEEPPPRTARRRPALAPPPEPEPPSEVPATDESWSASVATSEEEGSAGAEGLLTAEVAYAPADEAVWVEPTAYVEPEPEEEDRLEPAPNYLATTRPQALLLLDEVARYFRVAEPSSPIPWLIDRARGLTEKDFLSVLSAVFENGDFLSSE
jgi:predicted component of type VI protein secretion system